MGLSKKKQKNWRKAEARVGAKAKEKAKHVQRMQARDQFKASKRAAAEATRGGAGKGRAGGDDAGGMSELKGVDALFARMGDEDNPFLDDDGAEEGEEEATGSGSDDDDDESSAGAFHDIGSGDEDDNGAVRGVVEELEEDEEGPGAAARHAEELKAIREKDPEFYKFLVEQDKALLDFSAPDDEDEADEDEEDGGGAAPGGLKGSDVGGGQQGRVLTKERLERIQASAKDSFTACKAALNIYHIAVRSIEAKASEDAAEDGADADSDGDGSAVDGGGRRGKKEKSLAAQRKARQRLFTIDDEAIFSDVIEWSISNLLDLLRHHAGDAEATVGAAGGGSSSSGSGGSAGKRKKKAQKEAMAEEALDVRHADAPMDPTRCKRWLRVRVLAAIFWEETLFLLNHLVAQEMLEFVLRNCSTPEALAWLWPFKGTRGKYIKRCCSLWSSSSAQSVRLLAFLFLRNSAAMVMQAPDKPKGETVQLEALIKIVLRSFVEAASHGYSWRSISNFRFMENCVIELLRLEDAAAYRIGYVCLRQLALILRNACLNASTQDRGSGKGKQKSSSEKSGKKKGAQQQGQVLLAWPFVRAISLWAHAVGSLPSLRPLAYPLSMIAMGAAKHKLSSLQLFPFVNQCFLSLNRLGAQLETFVPISAHLLKVLGVSLQAMEKAHRKKGPKGGDGKALDSQVKAPDIEISLRLSEAQISEPLVLEAVGSSICFLFSDHLGLLSQSPGFPEVIAPIMVHLRKHSKHCRSEALRRQLRVLVEKCEASADAIRARRERLEEAPDAKRFLLFEPDTPIAKARVEALRRRTAEERTRVEAEQSADAVAAKAARKLAAAGKGTDGDPLRGDVSVPEGQKPPGRGTSKKALKRRKVAALKAKKAAGEDETLVAVASEAEPAQKKRRRGSAREQARKAGSLPDRDKVEEMDFGSGAED